MPYFIMCDKSMLCTAFFSYPCPSLKKFEVKKFLTAKQSKHVHAHRSYQYFYSTGLSFLKQYNKLYIMQAISGHIMKNLCVNINRIIDDWLSQYQYCISSYDPVLLLIIIWMLVCYQEKQANGSWMNKRYLIQRLYILQTIWATV